MKQQSVCMYILTLLLMLFAPLTSKHLIFDLGDVLVKQNKLAFARQVGIASFILYALIDWQDPRSIKHIVFDVLNHLGIQGAYDTLVATHEGQALPAIMCQWLAGLISSQDLIAQAHQKIHELDGADYFISVREKKLVTRVIETMFNPHALAHHTCIIPEGLMLLKEIKEKYGDQHQLYILSNWDPASFSLLYDRPEMHSLFELFNPEHIFISGYHNDIKPHTTCYEAFLAIYNLDAAECILIDDQENNIRGAQHVGITGIQLQGRDYNQLMSTLFAYLEEPLLG